jgi:hypothetical protein
MQLKLCAILDLMLTNIIDLNVTKRIVSFNIFNFTLNMIVA